MVKLLGILLLIAGFIGLSVEKVREEKASLRSLGDLKRFITYLLREIEYSHIPIPDICAEYKDRSEGKLKLFLEKVNKRYVANEGKSFDCIWREEIEMYKKEEKELMENLSRSFGFCNTKMQISAIGQQLQDIENMLLQKDKKFQDNKKLILYFGVMSGLLLSIILL